MLCVRIVAYENDFDAIAISPPGYGNTTQIDQDINRTKGLFRSSSPNADISSIGWVGQLGKALMRLFGYEARHQNGAPYQQNRHSAASEVGRGNKHTLGGNRVKHPDREVRRDARKLNNALRNEGDDLMQVSDFSSFWSPNNFLKESVESCLGVSLERAVIVSHSNFITRKFFFPFIMVRFIIL